MKHAGENIPAPNDSHPVHVLLAYDTTRTCRAILEMLHRISTQLRDQKLFDVKAFKFGLLEQMDPLKWTAADPQEAELAVVAFGETGAPGADFLRWLEHWAARHEGQNAALGLLPMGVFTGQSVRHLVRSLRKIAARHGLGFIYNPEAGLNPLQETGTVAA
jgi:hypothetical protein